MWSLEFIGCGNSDGIAVIEVGMEILVNSSFAAVCRVGEITLQYMFLPGFKENVKTPSFVLFLCKQEE